MSDNSPIVVGVTPVLEGTAGLMTSLNELQKAFADLLQLDPKGKFKGQLAAAQTSLAELQQYAVSTSTSATKLAESTVSAAAKQSEQAAEAAANTVRAHLRKVQTAYESARGDLSKPLAIEVVTQYKEAGAQLYPQDKTTANLAAVRATSAGKFTLDDFRAINGLPSRTESKSFAALLKAGMLEDLAQAQATSTLRASSAGKFTLDDFRALNGLPSRTESKSFAALLKAGMLEDQAGYKSIQQDEDQKARWRTQAAGKFTLDDFRALNGLPSRDESKSFSALIKAQMQSDAVDTVNTARLRARSAGKFTLDDYRSLMGLPSEAESKSASAAIRLQMEEQSKSTLDGIKRSVALANARPSGAYSISEGAGLGQTISAQDAAQKTLNSTQGEGAKTSALLRAEQQKLADGMRDAHSAARGLASGFGAMWLTWGNILPLMAGAGISNALVQMVRSGADVQQSLTVMRVLGDESASSVAGLNSQMLEMARSGPFGPKEIASAMKTLTLAGMSANEVSSSLRDTLNFSIAGDTGIQQAADTLTTIAQAFGVGSGKSGMAGGFAYVGDVISKAAAESKASVEDMSNAFKTASAINQQFGVTLEDTAVGLALLANAGIRGTAAGTSLRNMVSDLSGRTKHATAAMKELGVEAIDPTTGKIKDLGIVMGSLMAKLQQQASPAGALKYLQTIFDERGAKEAYAMFDALQTKAQASGESVATVFSDLKDKILNAGGFAAIAAAEMALTPLNQMKSVSAGLQATLVQTFDSIQPYLLRTAANLREIFASEGFRSTLQDLAVLVGTLVQFATEHARAIATVVLAYTGFRAVVTIMAELKAAQMAVAAAQAAMAVSAAAAGTAVAELGLAARIATAGNPLLLALSAAVTAAAVAWGVYEMTLGKVDPTRKDGESGHRELIRNLEIERDRLKDVNAARAQGITLEEYKAGKSGVGVLDQDQANIAKLRKDLANAKLVDQPAVSGIQSRLADAEKALEGKKLLLDFAKYEVKAEGKILADSQRKELADRIAAQAALYKGLSGGPADTSLRGANPARVVDDGSLAQTKKALENELSYIDKMQADQDKLLKARHSARLISDGEFYALEIEQATRTEDAKLQALVNGTEKYSKELVNRRKDFEDAIDRVIADPKLSDAAKSQEIDGLIDQLNKLEGEAKNTLQSFSDKQEVVRSNALTRITLQAISAQGAVKKVNDEARDFNRTLAEGDAKKFRAARNEDASRYLSDNGALVKNAQTAAYEEVAGQMDKLERAATDTRESLGKLDDLLLDGTISLQTYTDQQQRLTDILRAQKNAREGLNSVIDGRATQAGNDALDKANKDALKPVADSMRKALKDGIGNGFKEGQSAIDIFTKSLADNVESRMADAFMRSTIDPLVTAAMSMLNKLISDTVSGLSGGGFGGTGSMFSAAISWLMSANGNAFGGGGVHAFANGGAFTNGVYNQPTPFLFANGGSFKPGVMGEAGDEAVMPLRRGPDGRLGVQAAGGGGGSSITVNQPIVINAPNSGPETVAAIRSMMPGMIMENKRVVEAVIQQAIASRGGRMAA